MKNEPKKVTEHDKCQICGKDARGWRGRVYNREMDCLEKPHLILLCISCYIWVDWGFLNPIINTDVTLRSSRKTGVPDP
jgi:hypothetical protein